MSTETTPAVDPVMIPETMQAWQVTGVGEPAEVLRVNQVPVPVPGPGEVLIDVWSAGLNLADVALARDAAGPDRPPVPFTPGLEACGEIVGIGPGVDRVRLGERVIAVTRLPHGALARFAIARSADALPAPSLLDDTSASVFHIAYQTGWFGLYRRANLRVGDSLLVHAASGGFGAAAVQLGRAAGAKVIGVVSSALEISVVRRLGADSVIDSSAQDVPEAVRDLTEGRGVDVVYDPVGGPSHDISRQVIAFEGRIVVVGGAAGIPPADLGHLVEKNYAVLGLAWSRYRELKPELVARAHLDLCSLVDVGALAPLVSGKLSFADAAAGLTQLAGGPVVGRLAISPQPFGG